MERVLNQSSVVPAHMTSLDAVSLSLHGKKSTMNIKLTASAMGALAQWLFLRGWAEVCLNTMYSKHTKLAWGLKYHLLQC